MDSVVSIAKVLLKHNLYYDDESDKDSDDESDEEEKPQSNADSDPVSSDDDAL